jgi:hypothetical protein
MSDKRDFCEFCGRIFGDGVTDSACTFYDKHNHPNAVCVSCFEDAGGYDEAEQYKRYDNFIKENANDTRRS